MSLLVSTTTNVPAVVVHTWAHNWQQHIYIHTLLVDILDTSTHHKDAIVHHSRQLLKLDRRIFVVVVDICPEYPLMIIYIYAVCSVVTQLAAPCICTLLSVDILDTSTHHKDVIFHHSRQLPQAGPSHLCGGGGCVSIISTNDCIYMCGSCCVKRLYICFVLCGHTTGSSIYIYTLLSVDILDTSTHHKM